MFQEAGHIKNAVVFISRHIQFLHLMNSKLTLLLIPLGTKVQPQIILDPDYLPGYLCISYDYGRTGNLIGNKIANRFTKK